MSAPDPLPVSALRHEFTASDLTFASTAELYDVARLYEKARAEEAIRLGLAMKRPGYNIFAMAPDGQQTLAIVREFAAARAKDEPRPHDVCYVHDFDDPNRPKVLILPCGEGRALNEDLSRLIADLEEVLQAAFESEHYQTERRDLDQRLARRRERAYELLQEQARDWGIQLERDGNSLLYRAIHDGELITPEAFETLDEETQSEIKQNIDRVQEEIQALTNKFPKWRREASERIRALNQRTAENATQELFEELVDKYEASPEVVSQIHAIQHDIVETVMTLLAHASAGRRGRMGGFVAPQQVEALKRRYRINLLIDGSRYDHAPVVYEDDPTFSRLVGRVEKRSEAGTISSDVHMIRAGTLHRANGGYLLLDAHELLQRPLAWPALKQAIKTETVRIRSASRVAGMDVSELLDPHTVPLSLKVILLGTPRVYYLLHRADPDFRHLFKVLAEFDPEIANDDDRVMTYAAVLATLARRMELLPLDREAVARVMQYSLRLSGDRTKFSTDVEAVADVLREADHHAREGGEALVTRAHVDQALAAMERRIGRYAERMRESIQREFIKIASDGSRIGTVNALTVSQIGGFTFGRPNRMTARVHMGQGKTMDIERESHLGGSIHSKGVMILSGYIGAHYARKFPLAVDATLVFEQSYGRVDGDSASAAELVALLSAIAEVPLRQDLAMTGSVNQFGEIQAVGGVNEKIEGFFQCCKARGLTGRQGVILPHDNVDHLMLDDEVVAAVGEGQFHIYAIAHVDEAIELFTGMEAGKVDEDEIFPEGTFNDRVLKSLLDLAMRRRDFNRAQRKSPEGENGENGEDKPENGNGTPTPDDTPRDRLHGGRAGGGAEHRDSA